jgi:hypothetical protein
MIDHETKLSEYATPKFLPLKGSRQKPVCLVVDEIDKAKPELQNPMLEMFQFRSVNGRKLDIHSIIATGNLPDEGAFSLPVNRALTNRCSVYRVNCNFEPWKNWAVEKFVNPLVVNFLAKNPEFLMTPPADGDDTAYSNPSPRSWTGAAKDLDSAKDMDIEFQQMLVAGRVGLAAATKFRVWLEHHRHISPLIDKLVEDGTHPDTNNMDLGRMGVCAIGACGAIMNLAKTTPTTTAEKTKLEAKILKTTKNVFGWFSSIGTEFTAGAIKNTMSMKVIQDHKLTRVPELISIYKQLSKTFE